MTTNAPSEPPRTTTYVGTTYYDSGIIEKFVDQLYERARTIVYVYGMAGLVVGGGIGFIFREYVRSSLVGWIIALSILVMSIYIGLQRAFQLRLQAQIALCQVQIEKNTRQAALR